MPIFEKKNSFLEICEFDFGKPISVKKISKKLLKAIILIIVKKEVEEKFLKNL